MRIKVLELSDVVSNGFVSKQGATDMERISNTLFNKCWFGCLKTIQDNLFANLNRSSDLSFTKRHIKFLSLTYQALQKNKAHGRPGAGRNSIVQIITTRSRMKFTNTYNLRVKLVARSLPIPSSSLSFDVTPAICQTRQNYNLRTPRRQFQHC